MTNPSAVDLEGVIAFHKEQAATHEVSITAWLNRPEQVGEDHPAVQTHRAAVEWHTLAASELSRLQAENEGLKDTMEGLVNAVRMTGYTIESHSGPVTKAHLRLWAANLHGEYYRKALAIVRADFEAALAPNGEVGA